MVTLVLALLFTGIDVDLVWPQAPLPLTTVWRNNIIICPRHITVTGTLHYTGWMCFMQCVYGT